MTGYEYVEDEVERTDRLKILQHYENELVVSYLSKNLYSWLNVMITFGGIQTYIRNIILFVYMFCSCRRKYGGGSNILLILSRYCVVGIVFFSYFAV